VGSSVITYEQVSAGATGHAEAVEVRYDPARVSHAQLLDVFWRNIDPLAVNRQFCDTGTQYRNAIFYVDEDQKRQAEASLAALAASGRFDDPIATRVEAAGEFYPAEDYHQNYYVRNHSLQVLPPAARDRRLEVLWAGAQTRLKSCLRLMSNTGHDRQNVGSLDFLTRGAPCALARHVQATSGARDTMKLAPKRAGFSRKRLERITDHLERNYIEPQKIPGCQVAVLRHGQPAYFRSLGSMDLERNRPMSDDTIFRIYSMTKPITSVALMQLYERGLFQLNDPVHRVIPSWRNHRVYVSGEGEQMEHARRAADDVRHVLSHTAGLLWRRTSTRSTRAARHVHAVKRRRLRRQLAGVPCTHARRPLDVFLRDGRLRPSGRALSVSRSIAISRNTLNRSPARRPFTGAKGGSICRNYQRRADKTLKCTRSVRNPLLHPTFLSGGGV
jgi:methionine-S-sulfoxide reductase